MADRKFFVAGNWKMNLHSSSSRELAQALAQSVGSVTQVEIAVCPPFVYLRDVAECLAETHIGLGAQNMSYESSGAFTGEVSADMLKDCGCRYVILGHSERRHVMGEDDGLINRKVKKALDDGLHAIFCIGETLEQREANQTDDVVVHQVRSGLVGIMPEQCRDITLAYEPVWAIGTGKVATPEQAEEVHATIRQTLTELYGADIAQTIQIQYGGSVKPDNAAGLLSKPNIDGCLVGGASLKADDFAAIVQAAQSLA